MDLIVEVCTKTRSYPVYAVTDVAAALPRIWRQAWRQAAVIGDSNTAALFSQSIVDALFSLGVDVLELNFPAGEAHKTRCTKERLEDALLERGFDRSCCVVAVGGGIALDVAGYVAATYLRGVAHVNVATSLLAQVDAAVGGKTGVNTPRGKNLIGAFHQPHAVLIDTPGLASLSDDEYRNGLAEAVKHAVIADSELFESLERWAAGGARLLPKELLAACVRIKAEVVARDERESGLRQVLNFGHTVGHALEAASQHTLRHGAAVAVGMVIEARLAERVCGLSREDSARIEALVAKVGLPTSTELSFGAVERYLVNDKKALAGKIRFALPNAVGGMASAGGEWAMAVDLERLRAVWRAE